MSGVGGSVRGSLQIVATTGPDHMKPKRQDLCAPRRGQLFSTYSSPWLRKKATVFWPRCILSKESQPISRIGLTSFKNASKTQSWRIQPLHQCRKPGKQFPKIPHWSSLVILLETAVKGRAAWQKMQLSECAVSTAHLARPHLRISKSLGTANIRDWTHTVQPFI